jgi:hypothetical protein
MGATTGSGTAYPSGTHEFTPGFQWGSCYLIISCMCMFSPFSFGHCVVCSSPETLHTAPVDTEGYLVPELHYEIIPIVSNCTSSA